MKRKSSSLKVYPLIFFPRIKLIIKFWNKYEFVCLCYPVVLVDLTISSEKKNLNLIFYFHLYRYMQKKLEPFQFDFFPFIYGFRFSFERENWQKNGVRWSILNQNFWFSYDFRFFLNNNDVDKNFLHLSLMIWCRS